jgi:hypothetical protein
MQTECTTCLPQSSSTTSSSRAWEVAVPGLGLGTVIKSGRTTWQRWQRLWDRPTSFGPPCHASISGRCPSCANHTKSTPVTCCSVYEHT